MTRGRAIAAGTLGLVAVAALALALAGRGNPELTLVLDEALGLTEGAEVHAGGAEVGWVSEVRLGPGGYPRVQLELDEGLLVRRGTRATVNLYAAGAKERRYVDLALGDGPPLPHGAVLGREATDGPVEADAALSTLDPATRREVRFLLGRVDRTLRERGPAIDRTLAHSAEALGEAAGLLGDVTRDGEALRGVVRDGRRVSRPIAERPRALGATVDGLATTLGTTAARRDELAAVLEALPPTLETTQDALARVRGAAPELTALVRDLRPGARELRPTARELRPTLAAARPALAEARELVDEAPADLRPVGGLLGELRTVVGPARSVLDSANPMLDQTRVRLPDATGLLTGTADSASSYDLNGHGLRGGNVLRRPPRRRIGPSEARAGRLVQPYTRTPGVLEDEPWRDYRETFVGSGQP